MSMTLQRKFARNLRQIRNRRGLSQEELAERADLHRTYVSGLEREIRNPTLSVIEKIADALEVRPDELLAEKERD